MGTWEIEGIGRFNTCPMPQITDQSLELIKLHNHYRQGVLPWSGGLYEQPKGYLDAMEIIESNLLKV